MNTTALAKVTAEPQQLAPVQHTVALSFTSEQEQMIRDSFANGASREEFAVLMEIAKVRRLNPLLRQIHFVKRWDSSKKREVWASQVGIDGLRTIAERTGKYDGQDEPEYGPLNTKGFPQYAKVKVYRKDWSRPAVGVAYWEEYVQMTREGQPTRFWAEMPRNQLAKCAEALAMRKAFPEDLSGLYTPEEMAQAENGRPPSIDPHAHPDDDGSESRADPAVFAKLKGELDGLEAQVDTCDTYDKALKLRDWLGSSAKPSDLTKEIQAARAAQQLNAEQHKELSKIWQRTNRKLAKLETSLKPDVTESFRDDPEPEHDPDTDTGELSEEQERKLF